MDADPDWEIRAPCKNHFVRQKRIIPAAAVSHSVDWRSSSPQSFWSSRMDKRRRLKLVMMRAAAADAPRIASSAPKLLVAMNAQYKLASHAQIVTQRRRKHWFAFRRALA